MKSKAPPMLFSRSNSEAATGRDNPYHAYTTLFDAEVSAKQLGSVLGSLTSKDQAALDEAWQALQTGLLPWRTRLLTLAAEVSARVRDSKSAQERGETAI